MREPPFWWREPPACAARACSAGAALRRRRAGALNRRGQRAAAPVICIGNFTVGGAGKTPTALTTAQHVEEAGEQPVFLTRGYGGKLAGPVEVDPARHMRGQLAMSRFCLPMRRRPLWRVPGWPARQRELAKAQASIVMDDGFQNPALRKDIALLVVDERRGIGNRTCVSGRPVARAACGPARSCARALSGRSALARRGANGASAKCAICRCSGRVCSATGVHRRARSLAACWRSPASAIRRNFSQPLRRPGRVAATQSFPDHHRYTRRRRRRCARGRA